MSESDLADWASKEDNRLWTVRVKDVFGDSGLAGIVGLEIRGDEAEMTDFLLSCRVMGRGIENSLVHTLVSLVRPLGLERLRAERLCTFHGGARVGHRGRKCRSSRDL